MQGRHAPTCRDAHARIALKLLLAFLKRVALQAGNTANAVVKMCLRRQSRACKHEGSLHFPRPCSPHRLRTADRTCTRPRERSTGCPPPQSTCCCTRSRTPHARTALPVSAAAPAAPARALAAANPCCQERAHLLEHNGQSRVCSLTCSQCVMGERERGNMRQIAIVALCFLPAVRPQVRRVSAGTRAPQHVAHTRDAHTDLIEPERW